MTRQYIAHNSLLPFYLGWQLKPNNANYNLCFSYQLNCNKEVELLIEKLQELVELKAYLRQTFSFEEGKLVANIHKKLPAEVNILSSAIHDFPQIEEQLIKEPHDIQTKSSIRLTIVNFDDSDVCVALFNIHHIIMDGKSLDNFIIDLNRLLAHKEVVTEGCEEYIDNVRNESAIENLSDNSILEDYRSKIDDILHDMGFNSVVNSEKNSHYTEILPAQIQNKLTNFCHKKGISVFNLLLISQGIFLAKVFNQDCSLINYPVDIRDQKTINGCFVNIITFPLTLSLSDSYSSIIDSFKEEMPFFKSLSKVKPYESLNIDLLPSLACSNIAQPQSLVINQESYTAKNYAQIASSILSIKYREVFGKLYFTCDVVAKIIPNYLAQSFLSRFFHYLNKLLTCPNDTLITNDATFPKEKKQILSLNNTYRSYPKDKAIHQLFEELVEKIPNKEALVHEDCVFTYGEINRRANQLAHYLINEYDVRPNELVAICFDRNLYIVIAMLAILKAGAAYVSLGSKSLSERTSYILKNSKSKIVLTNFHIQKKLSKYIDSAENINPITIDHQEILINIEQQSIKNPHVSVGGNDLAHVIYTSGTTGSPKGVMIHHKGVVSLVKNVSYLKVSQLDTFALFSDLTFDASTFEIWGALLNGARLFIPSNRLELLSDAQQFKKTIKKYYVTVLLLTKTLFDQLFYLDETIFSGFTYLLIGGEPLNKSLIYNLATSQHKPENLVNAYGPAENTTISCTYQINKNAIEGIQSVPIGMPLSNRSAYVLDLHQNLLPIGAVGELYVGGEGLARGYWSQPELTNEKFISNPYQTKEQLARNENEKLYRTGDLARIMPDGNIEYFGRKDLQIKMRGYRIEPSEIENTIMTYPAIKQVAVLESKHLDTTGNSGNYLIAYYISRKQLDEKKLRKFLASYLPEYMLPNAFIHLKEFPTTVSGKLDKKSLPLPAYFNISNYVPPKNDKEKLICKAFCKILGIEKVSIKDDFFYLGGNSLKAIELVASLQANYKITVSDVFNMRCPENIAKNIHFSRDNLKYELHRIKSFFQYKKNNLRTSPPLQEKSDYYLASINQYPTSFEKKPIRTVLLTGAAGYLGCNLLRQILDLTDYVVFILIRADSDEKAFHRLCKKYQFYFNDKINDLQGSRIFVFSSDLESKKLGLTNKKYQTLIKQVDSIIHSAALTKHYGDQPKFYSANVGATVNLLELSKLTKLKDFHHISTVSVLDNNCDNEKLFTEDDVIEELDNQNNLYIKTKHEAEKVVLSYKAHGIKTNIYRVGNLAFISTNNRVQENIDDNAFFSRLNCLLALKVTTPEIGVEEISPVDLTAQAVIKIFDKQELSNGIYHVFNKNLCNVSTLLSQLDFVHIELVPIKKFLDIIIENINNPSIQNQLIMRFLLHQGWLDGKPRPTITNFMLQDRTNAILKNLGFEWPIITKDVFNSFVKKAYFHGDYPVIISKTEKVINE